MAMYLSRALFKGQPSAEDLPDAEKIEWTTGLKGMWNANAPEQDYETVLRINTDELSWIIVEHRA